MMTPVCTPPVHQRWSTANVDSRQALAYWIDTICQSFLEIEIDSPTREHFRAQLDQTPLGPATLSLVEADRQIVRRTRERIARSRYSTYFLLQLREGTARLSQYGRESMLKTGDCVLIDCTAPYEMDCLSTTRSVALRFPQEWLRNWIPAPESLAARPFKSTVGWGAALSAALAALDTDGVESLALPDAAVAEHIAALLALAAGPEARAASPGDKLYNRLLGTMRERADETDLTPVCVAEAHGISTRYLHYMFGEAGTTFGVELMRVRLERAHRLLSDKRFDALPIGEVAARCGFVAPSHFARRFRQTFGVVPTEFRARRR
jgi:AraC-like DNA-binding protein